MAQADLHRTRSGGTLVCRVQIDLGIDTPLVLCAPVVMRTELGTLVPKLHIQIRFDDELHVILMSQMVAIPQSELGPVVGNAGPWRDDIVAAVDLLVSGF